ncbi:opsin-1-like [Mytilus californianus]|uniref:opsin-1-like n=1 Tax=Mytilus californianus TaxID=6549 RepID=UPI002245D4E0|nr:opsin-1-like [Mytilus californianus]
MLCNVTGNTTNNHHELIAAQTPPWFHFTFGLILLTSGLGSFVSNGSVVFVFLVKERTPKYLSNKTSIVSIILCCLITFGFAISPLFGWNQYTYEGIGTACAIDLIGDNNNGQSFILALFAIYFVMPVSVIIFSYGNVYAKDSS